MRARGPHADFYSLIVVAETYVLPLLYLYYAYHNAARLTAAMPRFEAVLKIVLLGQAGSFQARFFALTAATGLLIPYNLLVAASLLLRRNLQRTCDRPAEVIVPFVSILFASAYNFSDRLFPAALRLFLAPARLVPGLALAGSALVLTGICMDLAALVSLRRSFALFVEVRDLVTGGMYRYVRHPMYLSHMVKFTGIFLVACTLPNLLITAVSAALFVWRALLEEKKIAEVFPEYRDYMRRTPFLFPRLFARSDAGSEDAFRPG